MNRQAFLSSIGLYYAAILRYWKVLLSSAEETFPLNISYLS